MPIKTTSRRETCARNATKLALARGFPISGPLSWPFWAVSQSPTPLRLHPSSDQGNMNVVIGRYVGDPGSDDAFISLTDAEPMGYGGATLSISAPTSQTRIAELIFLFIGLAASGISARLKLIAARGDGGWLWLYEENLHKPMAQFIFELLGKVAGLAAFVAAFTFLDWWIPIVAFVIGFWVLPGIVVNSSNFVAIYNIIFLLFLVSFSCSGFIIYLALNNY